jgi:hypothetical protein
LCDYSINSTIACSSSSFHETENQNNLPNSLIWDEYDENNEDSNNFNKIKDFYKPPNQTPRLIEIDKDSEENCDDGCCDYLRERHLMIEQELRSYEPVDKKHDYLVC